jgi:hypothetical protein
MKPFLQLSTFLIVLALISSCKSTATFDEINALRKGMSSTTVQEKLELSPDYSFDISRNGRKYTGECYWITVFHETSSNSLSQSGMGGISGRGGTGFSGTTTVSSKNIFVLLYDNNQLVYWGFLNEFSKSDDPILTPLANDIFTEYTKHYTSDGVTTITR